MRSIPWLFVLGCGSGGAKPAAPPAAPTPPATPAPAAPATPAPPATPTCTPGQVLEGNACKDVATTLHGLRWEIPCKPHKGGDACDAAIEKPVKTETLGGTAGTTYEVALHFRGVVEQESYKGGTADNLWYTGGKPADGAYNIYELQISDPAQTYYLNAGKSGIRHCQLLDYEKTVQIATGAKVTLMADAQDHRLITNHDDKNQPIVVPDVPPAPQPFDGQFIQMDVVSVKAR